MTIKDEKAELRQQLEKDIEAFLNDGGRIKSIPAGLSAQEAKFYTSKGRCTTVQGQPAGLARVRCLRQPDRAKNWLKNDQFCRLHWVTPKFPL